MRKAIWFVSIVTIIMMIGVASALPEFLDVFNTKYGTNRMTLDSCNVCHIQPKPLKSLFDFVPDIVVKIKNRVTLQKPNNLNQYGMDFKKNLKNGTSTALSIIEPLDSDKDGVSNINEINNLTFPGDPKIKGGKPKNKNNQYNQARNIINIAGISNYQPP